MDVAPKKAKDSKDMKSPSGFLKFYTLKLLSKKPSQGIIYPILHEFEEKGLVKATWNVEQKGPNRKYYYITDKEKEEFKKAKEKLTEAFNALF